MIKLGYNQATVTRERKWARAPWWREEGTGELLPPNKHLSALLLFFGSVYPKDNDLTSFSGPTPRW